MASLADAEEALRSTRAKANFQRLTRLLMCGGLRLLREIFDSIHSPADLPLRLGDPVIQTQLRGARLFIPEWNCLYPSPGVYGKSTDFDISLIFKLLRTICNLTPPPGPRGWDNLPNSSDHSLEADLVRIKCYRNEVHSHTKTMEITDTEFNDLWGKISEALIRIAERISREKEDEWKKSIADFLHNELTPEAERYNEELKMWYMQDMDVKSEVEKLKEVFKTELSDLKEEVAKLVIVIERFTGSPQIPHETGESRGVCAIPIPNQEQAQEDDVSNSGELQLNPQDSPTEIQIWTVMLSFKEAFELFLQYLRYKLNVFVRRHDVGSLLITVECSSLQILQGLWEDYRSGHLNEIAQEMLVTAEVLEKLGLDELRLKTFISEEEYEKGKQIFKDISDPFKQKPNLQREIVELRRRMEVTEETLKDLEKENIELKEQVGGMKEALEDLEKENIELRKRFDGMEEALEGKTESRKIDELVRKKLKKLKSRLESAEKRSHVELMELEQEVHRLGGTTKLLRDVLSLRDPVLASKLPGWPFGSSEGERFCQVIVNRQENEALDREKVEFESVFEDFGFHVDEKVCKSKDDGKEVIEHVNSRYSYDCSLFVCFIQSSVTNDGRLERFGVRPLSVSDLLAQFNLKSLPSRTLRQEMPKIFIIQGYQTTAALEADEPYDWRSSFEKSFSETLPSVAENVLCLFVPYREGYIATLLSVIKLSGSKQRDILHILSEAKKLYYERSHFTIPEPVHNLKRPVYLQ